MSGLISHPRPLALELSKIYGHCIAWPMSPVRWYPCPSCAKTYGVRMTQCRVCDGSGRLAMLE